MRGARPFFRLSPRTVHPEKLPCHRSRCTCELPMQELQAARQTKILSYSRTFSFSALDCFNAPVHMVPLAWLQIDHRGGAQCAGISASVCVHTIPDKGITSACFFSVVATDSFCPGVRAVAARPPLQANVKNYHDALCLLAAPMLVGDDKDCGRVVRPFRRRPARLALRPNDLRGPSAGVSISAAGRCSPSGTRPRRAPPAGPRESPTQPGFARAGCRRQQTPWARWWRSRQ